MAIKSGLPVVGRVVGLLPKKSQHKSLKTSVSHILPLGAVVGGAVVGGAVVGGAVAGGAVVGGAVVGGAVDGAVVVGGGADGAVA